MPPYWLPYPYHSAHYSWRGCQLPSSPGWGTKPSHGSRPCTICPCLFSSFVSPALSGCCLWQVPQLGFAGCFPGPLPASSAGPSRPRTSWSWALAPCSRGGNQKDERTCLSHSQRTQLGFKPRARALSSWGVPHRPPAPLEGPAVSDWLPAPKTFSVIAPGPFPCPPLSALRDKGQWPQRRRIRRCSLSSGPSHAWYSPGIDRSAGVEELLGH